MELAGSWSGWRQQHSYHMSHSHVTQPCVIRWHLMIRCSPPCRSSSYRCPVGYCPPGSVWPATLSALACCAHHALHMACVQAPQLKNTCCAVDTCRDGWGGAALGVLEHPHAHIAFLCSTHTMCVTHMLQWPPCTPPASRQHSLAWTWNTVRVCCSVYVCAMV